MRVLPLVSMAMLLALAGCPASPDGNGAAAAGTAATTKVQDGSSLAGSSWRLVEGLPGVDLSAVEVSLQFEGDPQADDNAGISGSGGCNRYHADLVGDGGSMRVGPIGATKRGCPGLRGEAEPRYFQALSRVNAITRDGDRLLLHRADDVPLVFEPAADAAS